MTDRREALLAILRGTDWSTLADDQLEAAALVVGDRDRHPPGARHLAARRLLVVEIWQPDGSDWSYPIASLRAANCAPDDWPGSGSTKVGTALDAASSLIGDFSAWAISDMGSWGFGR